METKNRQKLLMIIVGIAALMFLGDNFVVEPLIASWRARAKAIAELRLKLENGRRMLQRDVALRSRWNSMLTNAVPSNESMAEGQVFKAFDRWERDSGITRISIKPQWKPGDDDSYMALECRADYNGDIDRVKQFLYEVEKDLMGLKVEDVEITSRDDNGQQISLALQVSGLQLNPPSQAQQP